ncbi:hypothetical protein MFIFM68171_09450 [Madurella fahalii]|uniref:C2H2-type domain-containing protein n=1 Tax=Madurella fahalii TaxID=1157608 RepID=A0ABQ0GNE4_9PEZI
MHQAEQAAQAITALGKIQSKIDLTTIARAFAYHKILAIDEEDIEDVETDKEDGYDEFDSDESLWDNSDDDSYDSNDEEEEGGDDGGGGGGAGEADDVDDDDDDDVERHLVKTTFTSTLVLARSQSVQAANVCDNSRYRKGLWLVTKSELISELTNLDMGFLSQTTYIALQSQLYPCRNEACIEMRKKMKDIAPECKWTPFRDWALVAMSCQAAMDDAYKVSHAHTHLARAVALFCMALKKCLLNKHREKLFLPFLDGDHDPRHRIDLATVSNLIYWMAKIQSQLGIGPRRFGRWNHHLLPSHITLPSIKEASEFIEKMGICKNRLWNLVNVSDRKQSDLPDIVAALKPYQEELRHKDHNLCTPSKCQWAQMDSTGVKQLHKCKLADEEETKNAAVQKKEPHQLEFPVELLETALEMGKSTAWLCKSTALSGPNDPYIAISHVWSDGTGVGVKNAGTVNKCLFNFFESIAKKLGCKAIWWDAISIPKEPKARSKALNKMHGNYANAQYTVVHDRYLLKFPWKEDGSPCLALVLSTWFTRGWTALELFMSKKVRVLFKDPVTDAPIMKDLDDDILAKSPSVASRAHWLATTLIQRLRRPIDNVGDLLAVLSPRSTSWVRDRTIISALLAGVPDCDFTQGESVIATKVLEYLGKIPYACLFHGKPTMRDRGEYSWCAATLDDMPVDISTDLGSSSSSKSNDYLEIDETGAVEGKWRWRKIGKDDVENLRPFGNDLDAVVKVETALRRWNRCLLLRQPSDKAELDGSLALLVIPVSIIPSEAVLKCRYIGAVIESKIPSKTHSKDAEDDDEVDEDGKGDDEGEKDDNERENDGNEGENDGNEGEDEDEDGGDEEDRDVTWQIEPYTIRIGGTDSGGSGMLADTADDLMFDYEMPCPNSRDDEDEKSIHGDEDLNSEQDAADEDCSQPGRLRQWLEIVKKAATEPPTNLIASLSLQDSTPPTMGDRHLLLALKSKNEEAARYLVANGIDLSSMNAEQILNSLGYRPDDESTVKSVLGLKLFADILADADKIERAIDMYEGVIWATEKKPNKTRNLDGSPIQDLNSDGLLRLCYAKHALGKTLLKRDPGYHGPSSAFKRAHHLFASVMKSFKMRNSKRADAENRKQQKAKDSGKEPQKPPEEFVAPPLKRANTTTREKSQQEKEKEKAALDRIKSEHRWYRLELNTAAELALLEVAMFELGSASETYSQALNRFGSVTHGHPGFEGLWERRRAQSFKIKKEADERAADIYQRALKRFNTMFRKDHALIAITSLHLGINYTLRSMFSQAEEQLERSLEIFHAQLCCPLDAKARIAENHTHIEEHPIFGLTHYYLGILCMGQQKFMEAQKHLKKTQSIVADWKSGSASHNTPATILELSALYAFGNAELRRRRPNFNEAERSFQSMVVALPELGNAAEAKRLGFQAQLGLARVFLGRGKPADAVSYCEKHIESCFGSLDNLPDDLDVCEALEFLGQACEENEQYELAEARFKRSLAGYEALQGDKDHDYLQVARQLGAIYGKNGKQNLAKEMLSKAYEGFAETVGSYHSSTLKASWQLGRLCLEIRDLPAASKYCEIAYTGFRKIAAGKETRPIAETAQTLGDVYFEQAKLSKAKETYEAAFKAFEAVFREANTKAGEDKDAKSKADDAMNADAKEPPITDKATLLAALEVAKVCALIRHFDIAEKRFKLAVDGFSSSKRSGLATVLAGLDAKLKLGIFYREQKRFKESWELLNDTHQGLTRLCEKEAPENKMRQVKVKLLQTQLARGEVLLDINMKRDEKKSNNGKNVDSKNVGSEPDELSSMNDGELRYNMQAWIEEAQQGLIELLGKNDLLSLHATTVLGELYMTTDDDDNGEDDGDDLERHDGEESQAGESDSSENIRGSKGEDLVREVLETYKALGIASGHPKKLRVIEMLITYYAEKREAEKLEEMQKEMWEDLKGAYGVDVAAIIMDLKNVRRPVRDEYYDDSDSESESESDFDFEYDSEPGDEAEAAENAGLGYAAMRYDSENEEGGDDDDGDEDEDSDLISWDSDSDEDSDSSEDDQGGDADSDRADQEAIDDRLHNVHVRQDSAIEISEPPIHERIRPVSPFGDEGEFSGHANADQRQRGEYRFDRQQLREQWRHGGLQPDRGDLGREEFQQYQSDPQRQHRQRSDREEQPRQNRFNFQLVITQLSAIWDQLKHQQDMLHEFDQAQITSASDVIQKLERWCQRLRRMPHTIQQTDWMLDFQRQLIFFKEAQLRNQRTSLADSMQRESNWNTEVGEQLERYRQQLEEHPNEEWIGWALDLSRELEAAKHRLQEQHSSGQEYRQQQLRRLVEFCQQLDAHREQLIRYNRGVHQEQSFISLVSEIYQALSQYDAQLGREGMMWEQATQSLPPHLDFGSDLFGVDEEGEAHQQGLDNEDEVFCAVCRGSFQGKEELEEHMNRYAELEVAHWEYRNHPASCPACSMNFPDQERCDRHVAYYAGIDKQHLVLHEEKTECPVCQMGFPDVNGVDRHLNTYADEEHMAYSAQSGFRGACRQCGWQFSRRVDFDQHVMEAHGCTMQ